MADFNDLADVDDIADLDLGDVGRMQRRRRMSGGGGGQSISQRSLIPRIAGVPARGYRKQMLGLGSVTFNATSGTSLTLQASPQRPFKGRRLILDVARSGTTSTGLLTMTRLDVGSDNQLVGSGAVAVSAFAATAFDADIALAPATPGIMITAILNIGTAPTTTDTVGVSGTIFGDTIGG